MSQIKIIITLNELVVNSSYGILASIFNNRGNNFMSSNRKSYCTYTKYIHFSSNGTLV